jgi:DNA-binding transcriptional regulator GbsR (MarR family)
MARAKNKGTNISKQPETCVKSQSVASKSPENTENALEKGKPGRKPIEDKLTPEFFDDLTLYASQSITNQEIAETLGISYRTFYRLLARNQEFKDAYEQGINNRKYTLEKALLKRAEGFIAEETKIETDKEGNVIKKTVTDKNYVPDSVSLIFALKNLYSDKYKDRIESVNTVNVNIQQIQNIPDEELLQYANMNLIEADFEIE